MRRLLLLVGTKKGAFIIDGNADRRRWRVRGPFCEAWPIHHVVGDARTHHIFAGGGNEWFGPAVWKTIDLGDNWTHSSVGLSYTDAETPINAVWSLHCGNGRMLAGVQPAGLFRSDDDGITWSHLDGLQKHPSRAEWQPGGAGLILHSILQHPHDENQIWIGISAAGVFHSADNGNTWAPRNRGTRADFAPEDQRYPEFGQCVHAVAMAAGLPHRLYQQNHCGMYRSDDGGQNWQSMEAGLPSSFGFPIAAHPRDPDTVFLVPLNGDTVGRYMPDAKAAAWRTRDGGRTWQDLRNGLPQEGVYFGVLRQALATDGLEPAGVYFGTSSGSLYASADEGDSWSCVAEHLPAITSVETLLLEN